MDVKVGPWRKLSCRRIDAFLFFWIDAFELWCWRRLLWVPWTARRSNQSILQKINPEYSLEGLMLKLKLGYFGHLSWRTDLLVMTLMLGKLENWRRKHTREDKMVGWHHLLHGHEFEQTQRVGNGQGILACSSLCDHKESDMTEQLNWTEKMEAKFPFPICLKVLPGDTHILT